ncbi:UPF0149 family protein [Shimwellia blattae]|uniref:Putative metal-binding protein n=1 Tax=Shimwellia blattae (strain ATCC 29907 / DSM 4481 / JCM 1650 / NBRC 105725 / CDC 9005-74) TaxID=630626 RepID=I2B7Z8_SHIBC|nr:UPF0149 family protein [Shimwellia blattae]AFJ46652.1 putative metal-binding protein [Shimwellia blattae DSM 4481 = NBRC 105725]GAB80232.1 hypothetical protein YecA [Shimwellia blattae DSM 4481 = NBRC 105725]VDY64126.1 Predicted metal-binding protein related to the C-terminal domain of SecA [Shimwellia blattae]VEC22256.1 Predicted metal-binding protein related to the C-terminal domain of SecA [Shimwellia blattae]
MSQGPLDAGELEWLDDMLLEYGSDASVLDVSELDGFLTAVLSGPVLIPPQRWIPAMWGGNEHLPHWHDPEQQARFSELLFQHMEDIALRLHDARDQFDPMFGLRDVEGQEVTIVEEWCFGYMRGVALGRWSALPPEVQPALDAIALHGEEQNFDRLDTLSADEFLASIEAIRPAALAIYQWWRKTH